MSYPPYIREKAREMRVQRRLTIDEIAERLAISRTTIYYWVRDLPVARDPARATRAQAMGNRATCTKYLLLRESAYDRGRAEFAELVLEPIVRDFICLYIAEGFKRNRNRVSLANSDATVVGVADRCLRRFSSRQLTYRLQHHADQDLGELATFWGACLNVDSEQIRFQRKSNSNQLAGRTWRSTHGVLTVSTSDTLFRARLQAWMDSMREAWV